MSSITFITSNKVKLLHARHIAEPYSIEVAGKSNYGVAYDEPRSNDREEILLKSYEDALKRWQRSSSQRDGFFFIEDTSVRISALSDSEEFPGVNVKYWMRDITFADLDSELRIHNNDRSASIRSDVVLHLPEWFRSKHGISESFQRFTGTTFGSVISAEVDCSTNLLYPWLDSQSFNKWFSPDGRRMPLSALPIDEADSFDFRRGSIGAAFEYLSSMGALDDTSGVREIVRYLPSLIPPVVVVVGLPCAGKTTLGIHLSEKFGYYHLEASDFMRKAFLERHGFRSALSIEAFAKEVLLSDPAVVVRLVLNEIRRSSAELVVVTGFRSLKELEIFEDDYLGPCDIQFLIVEANRHIRFQRSVNRQREDAASSIDSFTERDSVQLLMGLKEIRDFPKVSSILNEGTVEEFLEIAAAKASAAIPQSVPRNVRELHRRAGHLEEAILVGLLIFDQDDISRSSFTTTEITHKLNEIFVSSDFETSKNNVSRYFNFRIHPYFHVSTKAGVRKYRLSATGRSRAIRLLEKWPK